MKKLIRVHKSQSEVYLYEGNGGGSQGGGIWHFMYSDQWGNDNYQCQPVVQNANCWPVWAWKVE